MFLNEILFLEGLMKYILSIDQGTTSSRALIINHEGKIISIAQREFRQIFPQLGWVEHDPSEIWSTQQAVIHEALAKVSLRLDDIAGIGITNQRETTVLWDKKTSKPIHNAIVWQDRRTTDQCRLLKTKGHESLIRKKTGLLLDPYFSATKIKWMLDHVEGAREKAENGELAFGTIDSWLIWKLTGGEVHATDITNASRTMLYNIHEHKWDKQLLELFHIPQSMLPKVTSCSEVIGISQDGIPIAGVAGDQQAALFGQGCFTAGKGKITYGTGCFILINTGQTPPKESSHLLTTVGYQIGNETSYAIEGSVFIGGAVVQWLRDNLGIIKQSKDVETLANTVKDNGGVYFVPAFTGLGAPHWNPYAKGLILGITRGTKDAHIARAALEGIAHQVADILDIIHFPMTEFHVDGGASKSDMIMELQASIQDIPLKRSASHEVTALGAAYLAGLAIGYWNDLEEISKLCKMEKTFYPKINKKIIQQMRSEWKLAIKCSEMWHEQK